MRALVAVAFTLAALACAGTPAQQGGAAQAERLYRSKCSACHRAYPPSSRDRAAWAEVVSRMAPRAKLSDAERALVLEYLQSHAQGAPPPEPRP